MSWVGLREREELRREELREDGGIDDQQITSKKVHRAAVVRGHCGMSEQEEATIFESLSNSTMVAWHLLRSCACLATPTMSYTIYLNMFRCPADGLLGLRIHLFIFVDHAQIDHLAGWG